MKTLTDSRSAYASLRDHFLRDIEHPNDLSTADPLADDETVSSTALAIVFNGKETKNAV